MEKVLLERVCEDCEYSKAAVGAGEMVLTCDHKKPSYRLIVKAGDRCNKFRMSCELVAPEFARALAEGARLIPLTQDQYAIVDADDYAELGQYNWYAVKSPRAYYAARSIKHKSIQMHRVIMDAPKGLFVDHINHNGLDNRKSNLRLCTCKQNAHNRRPIAMTSRYKGVHWKKRAKKFAAKICIDGKNKHLGYFDDEVEAAKAYDKKAVELFGEYAYLNFPDQ